MRALRPLPGPRCEESPSNLIHGRALNSVNAETVEIPTRSAADRSGDDASTAGIEDLTTRFASDPVAGLSLEGAARRLAEEGPNALRAAPPVPTWRKVLGQIQDLLIYLLLGAVLVSVVVWFFEDRTGVPVDAIVIAVVVIANALLRLPSAGSGGASRRRAAADGCRHIPSVIRNGHSAPGSERAIWSVATCWALSEGDAVGADA